MQQNRFHVVVQRVPHCYRVRTDDRGGLRQKLVSDLARRFFQGKAVFFLVGKDITFADGSRNAQTFLALSGTFKRLTG